MFVYNADNQTSTSDVAKIIYEEHALNYHQRVDHYPRSLPLENKVNPHSQDAPVELDPRIKAKLEKSLIFPPGKIFKTFKKLDGNHDGYLGTAEMVNFMASRGILSQEESEQLLGWAQRQLREDKNYMNYAEFGRFLGYLLQE
jgi:hypothetical protein